MLPNSDACGQLLYCEGIGNGNYTIRIDTVFTNIGVVTSPLGSYDLTGFNTYHLYLVCEAADDLMQAVAGDAYSPTTITTTTTFFQEPNLATATENGINPLLFPVYPELEYDSFVTIGLNHVANAGAGETATAIAEDASILPINGVFENGGNIVLNSVTGGTWYIADAESAANAYAGSDLEVLFAQLTTDGTLGGEVWFQVYRDGIQDGSTCIQPYLSLPGFFNGGCTDPEACNHNPEVQFDDGSCDYCSCSDSFIHTVSFPDDSLGTYFLEWDLVANHDTTDIAELAGTKTYRAYIRTAEPLDTVSAIFGDSESPTSIVTTTDFHQSVYGGLTPNSIQPVLYPFFPDLQYDSWVTIGIENVPVLVGAGYGEISTIGYWLINVPTFDPTGGDIIIDDPPGGTWFQFPGALNGVPDADQRVLIGQFTTSGVISGTLNVQILPQFLPEDDDQYRLTFDFTTENLGSNPDCSCDSGQDTDGDGICDDVDPCTGYYDFCGVCNGPGPIYDCGCTPIPDGACNCAGDTLDLVGVCGGDCEEDIDGDGICDVNEIFGCTDAASCTFEALATENDGSCLYPDAIGVCGGDCTLDLDANGICDTDDAAHCGPGTIWDFDSAMCVIACPSDINLDGAVAIGDLLTLLTDFANFCEDLE